MPEADCLIHAGDWTHRGEKNLTIDFLKWFNEQSYVNKIFVAGNHDYFPQKYSEEFRELVKFHAPTCTYLEDESTTIAGLKVHGSPVSPYFGGWAFNCVDAEIQKHWDLIPRNTEILITHTPMFGYGDKLGKYGSQPYHHVGCQYLREEIDKHLNKLKLLVVGHIHCGYGVYNHNDLIIANAAVLDDSYNLMNAPIVIEL